MPSKITCYLDCVSPYSYFAFTYLQRHREALAAHNVEVDFVPVFLGGINAGSGNKPPWMLPAKEAYMSTDLLNAKCYFGLPNVKKPSVFPTITLRPQRGLVYIKANHPTLYLEAFRLLWVALWENDIDISQEPLLSATLAPLFTPDQLTAVIKATDELEYKKKLLENTAAAVKHGAFGAPWFVVRNGRGEEREFFGSDRFHFMFMFLELPMRDMEVLVGSKL